MPDDLSVQSEDLPFDLCWDEPDASLTPLAALPGARTLVLWPSRVNADVCFESAGFHDFCDTGLVWDETFELLGRLLVHGLSVRAGAPHALPARSFPIHKRLLGHTPPVSTPASALLDAAHEDSLGRVTVLFGDPVAAALTTSDGHPLWWLHSAPGRDDLPEAVRAMCGAAFGMRRRALDWSKLSPFAGRVVHG